MKSLGNLSKEALTLDEIASAFEAMKTESDRGVAIMGSALVEYTLKGVVKHDLKNAEDDDAIWHGSGAPLGTFSNLTIMAYALGIIDKGIRDDINSIRYIRNQFSHALRAIDFERSEISNACKRLRKYVNGSENAEADKISTRLVYMQSSARIGTILLNISTERLKRKTDLMRVELENLKRARGGGE